jgi:hypothetical protein
MYLVADLSTIWTTGNEQRGGNHQMEFLFANEFGLQHTELRYAK